MNCLGKVAVMGGGSWATALAKLLLNNCESILWYMRRDDRIEDFKLHRRNPTYLSDVEFDIDRIEFSSDINEVCEKADTLLLVMPSPYFKSHVDKITVDISDKFVVSAVKGIVPDGNMIISEYMQKRFGVKRDRMLVVSGPTHAEEVALGRKSFLTVACENTGNAEKLAEALAGKALKTIISNDVIGIEYASVLKNVYSICSGIIHGLKTGDNFQAMLVSNAIREMERFVNTADPRPRQICDSVYLGDLLVTSYSRFSRNHNFGALIGRGYSVTAARMEMEQTAEGYFGTKCIHEINENMGVQMPILNGVFDILYRNEKPAKIIQKMSETFI